MDQSDLIEYVRRCLSRLRSMHDEMVSRRYKTASLSEARAFIKFRSQIKDQMTSIKSAHDRMSSIQEKASSR
jgi:hypothetical protein